MRDKSWPALDIRFSETDAAGDPDGYFAAFLDDHAPTAILETSTDGRPVWRVFFASAAARDRARAAMAIDWPQLAVKAVDVPDEHWAAKSQAALTAIQVDRIIVTPPWDVARAHQIREPGSMVVLIEPSMGFGTGHHESTRLCLAALQRVDLAGKTVLDLGTGSGVLAIAAALLGCTRAVALDNDPDAVAAAEQNVALNGVQQRIVVRQEDLVSRPPAQADVVVGNLTGALLRRHAGVVQSQLAPGGLLILSGFTEDEALAVEHAFAPLPVVRADRENGWLALTLQSIA
jgi:ribosomal protein L11 methyltransferase